MAQFKNFMDFMNKTDFKQMKKQKRILVKAGAGMKLTPKEQEEIEGVLNFFDSFQDLCQDVYGINAFPKHASR
jgi:hypothetical protein